MAGCDARPGYPLDRTVRGDRDRVIPSGQRRPGQPKPLSDVELVCLAMAQVLLGAAASWR